MSEQDPFAAVGGRDAALREVINASLEGRMPLEEQREIPAISCPDDDEDGLTAADLVEALLGRCEPVTIPATGKTAWVFPLGDTDYSTLLRWAMEKSDSDEPQEPRARAVWQEELRIRMQAYQVLLCCRQKPQRNAKRCFGKGDYETVRKLLSRQIIAEICRVSDGLGAGEEALGPGVRAFFELTQSCCAISSSTCASSSASPPGLAEVLAQLASLASRALSRGSWSSGMTDELKGLLS